MMEGGVLPSSVTSSLFSVFVLHQDQSRRLVFIAANTIDAAASSGILPTIRPPE